MTLAAPISGMAQTKMGFCNGPLFVNPSSTCDILSPGLASVRGRRMAAT